MFEEHKRKLASLGLDYQGRRRDGGTDTPSSGFDDFKLQLAGGLPSSTRC